MTVEKSKQTNVLLNINLFDSKYVDPSMVLRALVIDWLESLCVPSGTDNFTNHLTYLSSFISVAPACRTQTTESEGTGQSAVLSPGERGDS